MRRYKRQLEVKRILLKPFKCRNDENYEKYSEDKKEVKKVVRDPRGMVYEDLYQQRRLGTRQGEKDTYKLAKLRENQGRDLIQVGCLKDSDQKLLMREYEVKGRWRSYFDKLFNRRSTESIEELDDSFDNANRRVIRKSKNQKSKLLLKS